MQAVISDIYIVIDDNVYSSPQCSRVLYTSEHDFVFETFENHLQAKIQCHGRCVG